MVGSFQISLIPRATYEYAQSLRHLEEFAAAIKVVGRIAGMLLCLPFPPVRTRFHLIGDISGEE
jgi:hypothetical protein